ncbi:hypothetical protein P3T27_002979 [Kitasatospora sp. MAA19]|nr:hypothetical protein [Kitasatospora sp. MAA19]
MAAIRPWAVRQRAVAQPDRQVRHAGPAGADRVGTLGGHPDRFDAGRQHEVEDRQVVRGEVPQHVDVRLHQSEVDPHRVEELNVADLAAVHQFADPAHHRGVAEGVVAHQHQPAALGQVDQLGGLGGGGGDRLLHQDVLAGLQRDPHQPVVRGRGRGHRDRPDPLVVEHPAVGAGRPDRAVLPQHGTGLGLVQVAQPVQPQRRGVLERYRPRPRPGAVSGNRRTSRDGGVRIRPRSGEDRVTTRPVPHGRSPAPHPGCADVGVV